MLAYVVTDGRVIKCCVSVPFNNFFTVPVYAYSEGVSVDGRAANKDRPVWNYIGFKIYNFTLRTIDIPVRS